MQPLFGGTIVDKTIRCPKHGACFALDTGRPVNGVADRPLATYRLRIRGDIIQIEMT